MALTITKQKPKAEKLEKAEIINPNELTIEELADEYGTLEDQYNALMASPIIARFDQVKKALNARLEVEAEPQDSLEITGKQWLLEIGAAAKEARSIGDLNMARKFMGEQAFMACAKITVKDAEAYLTPEQLAKVLEPGGGYTKRRKIVSKFLG